MSPVEDYHKWKREEGKQRAKDKYIVMLQCPHERDGKTDKPAPQRKKEFQ